MVDGKAGTLDETAVVGGRDGKFDKTIVVGRRDGNKMKLLCWVEELWWFVEFEYMLD